MIDWKLMKCNGINWNERNWVCWMRWLLMQPAINKSIFSFHSFLWEWKEWRKDDCCGHWLPFPQYENLWFSMEERWVSEPANKSIIDLLKEWVKPGWWGCLFLWGVMGGSRPPMLRKERRQAAASPPPNQTFFFFIKVNWLNEINEINWMKSTALARQRRAINFTSFLQKKWKWLVDLRSWMGQLPRKAKQTQSIKKLNSIEFL